MERGERVNQQKGKNKTSTKMTCASADCGKISGVIVSCKKVDMYTENFEILQENDEATARLPRPVSIAASKKWPPQTKGGEEIDL